MQISDIKLRQCLQINLIPLRLTRLSRIDVYEHLALIQAFNKSGNRKNTNPVYGFLSVLIQVQELRNLAS